MGQPKPLLRLGGETMLERQIRILKSVCSAVAAIGPSEDFPGVDVPVFADQLPGRGPLGGIYTGLMRTRTEYNFFLACDLPYVTPLFLAFLVPRALEHRADATVPELPDFGVQPVCAIYRRSALRMVRARLNADLNKSQDLIYRLRAKVIPRREIARAGFPYRIFANINTAEEYQEARLVLSHRI